MNADGSVSGRMEFHADLATRALHLRDHILCAMFRAKDSCESARWKITSHVCVTASTRVWRLNCRSLLIDFGCDFEVIHDDPTASAGVIGLSHIRGLSQLASDSQVEVQ